MLSERLQKHLNDKLLLSNETKVHAIPDLIVNFLDLTRNLGFNGSYLSN
jgi:hypothetical protein